MGVQVDRQVEALAQRGDQASARPGARSSPAMSLIASTWAPASTIRSASREVVVERVELLARVGQVAGVAERDLGDGGPGRAHGLDRRPHLLDVVERVEDPEHVDPGLGGLLRRTPPSPRSGTACSRPCCGRAAASAGRCWAPPGAARPAAPTGPRPGSAAPRRTSHRPRPRATTAAGVIRATWPATATRSRVRTRVASSDWWASRNVVSVTATRSCARSRRANSSGPTSSSSWRVPSGAGTRRSTSRQLGRRVEVDRRARRAAG